MLAQLTLVFPKTLPTWSSTVNSFPKTSTYLYCSVLLIQSFDSNYYLHLQARP